jgi:carbohydrate diacid regulator
MAVPSVQNWMSEELLQLWAHFMEEDRSGELQQTLVLFYLENGEQQHIAERLRIHRNTLRYRLQRITELTGKDPRNYQELFLLMSARWLYLLDHSGMSRDE